MRKSACHAIFYALVKLEYLLRDIHITLRTDHRTLTFLNESFQQKVKRWKLAIMFFNFDIEHIPGKQNVVADALSKLINIPKPFQLDTEEDEEVDHVYVISEEVLRDVGIFSSRR